MRRQITMVYASRTFIIIINVKYFYCLVTFIIIIIINHFKKRDRGNNRTYDVQKHEQTASEEKTDRLAAIFVLIKIKINVNHRHKKRVTEFNFSFSTAGRKLNTSKIFQASKEIACLRKTACKEAIIKMLTTRLQSFPALTRLHFATWNVFFM